MSPITYPSALAPSGAIKADLLTRLTNLTDCYPLSDIHYPLGQNVIITYSTMSAHTTEVDGCYMYSRQHHHFRDM